MEWKQASTERELVLRYQSPGAVNYTVTSEKWTEGVRQEMEKLLSQFDIVDMTIESEYWEEFYTLYQSSAKDKSGSYDEEVHADVYMVILMGDAGAVNDRKAEIEEVCVWFLAKIKVGVLWPLQQPWLYWDRYTALSLVEVKSTQR